MNKKNVTIENILKEYSATLEYVDIEVIISHVTKKSKEFLMTHPEYELSSAQKRKFESLIARRIKGEPIAYLIGHKEFYGLDFLVNKYALVPRPETELMVEHVLALPGSNNVTFIDIGTGSGCITTSIAHTIKKRGCGEKNEIINYYATDISSEALKVAKKNAKLHGVDSIKFIQGDLLTPILRNKKLMSSIIKHQSLIVTANLPYLSKAIYNSAPIDVKKFEPKSALYSAEDGLQHYRKLLEQLTEIQAIGHISSVIAFFEISPEQKNPITKLIKRIFPLAKIEFTKDLAGKWRLCKVMF